MRTRSASIDPVVLSDPLQADLVVYRGDSGLFRVTVLDALGAPLDVSSAVWLCQIRTQADDPDPLTTLTVTPVAGDPSSVDVLFGSAMSATLSANAVWDLQMTLDSQVTTLLTGRVMVTKDVSRV